MTPIVEWQYSVPTGNSFGAKSSLMIAPGVTYAGEGWELAVEAQVPGTASAGSGIGVIAQLHLALDFHFPNSLGRPLFGE